MTQERRKYKRISEQYLVAYVTSSPEEMVQDEGMALSEDFSHSGIHLKLPRLAHIGDHLDLTFNIEQDIFSVRGEVVWMAPNTLGCDIGVRIVALPEDYTDRIQSILNASPESTPP